MKILLIYIVSIVLFLSGCCVENNTSKSEEQIMQDIYITEIDHYDIYSDIIEFPIDSNKYEAFDELYPISTNESAQKLATDIIEKLHRDNKFSDYSLVGIVHATQNNTWRFEYSPNSLGTVTENLIECGGLNVAIDGNTGILIYVSIEE